MREMWRRIVPFGVALLVAGCGGSSAVSPSVGHLQPATTIGLPAGSHLLRNVEEPLSEGYVAAGSVYYFETAPVGEHVGEFYDLTRINSTSGALLAHHRFDNAIDQQLVAARSLWVTTTNGDDTTLWRLNAQTLAPISQTALPARSDADGIAGSMAIAGGELWVGDGTLDRVSLTTGKLDKVVTPPHSGPVQVAAGADGRILLASLGYSHPTYIARLDPRTGAVLATTTVPHSFTQPTVAGIVGSGAWIENTVGTKVTAQRLDATTLHATPTRAWPRSATDVSLRVLDGVLWVTRPDGGANVNYCANPVTGRPLVTLPPLRGDSVFLGADASSFYFTDVPVNAHSVKLERAPISRTCGA